MPWVCARRLFGPPPNRDYGPLEQLSFARTIIGFSIAAMIYDYYRAGNDFATSWASSIEYTLFVSIGFTLTLAFFVVARSHDYSRQGLEPIIRAAAGLLVILAYIPVEHFRNELSTVGYIVGILALWYIPFLLASGIYWFLNPFGSSEKYPVIGPVVTGATVIIVTVISLISGDDGSVPLFVWLGVTIFGFVTSLSLVAAEIYLLMRRQPNLIHDGFGRQPNSNEPPEIENKLVPLRDAHNRRIKRTPQQSRAGCGFFLFIAVILVALAVVMGYFQDHPYSPGQSYADPQQALDSETLAMQEHTNWQINSTGDVLTVSSGKPFSWQLTGAGLQFSSPVDASTAPTWGVESNDPCWDLVYTKSDAGVTFSWANLSKGTQLCVRTGHGANPMDSFIVIEKSVSGRSLDISIASYRVSG